MIERPHYCACIDHFPSVNDSVYHGMPQLKVSIDFNGRPFFAAFCPKCGRGGKEYRTVEAAIRSWNHTQETVWKMNGYKPMGDAPKTEPDTVRHLVISHYSFGRSSVSVFPTKEAAVEHIRKMSSNEHQSDMLTYAYSDMEANDDWTYVKLSVTCRDGSIDVTEYEYAEVKM